MQARTIKQIADSTSMSTSFISNGLPFQVMGLKLKEINDALGTLQTLGIQHVASLPEIVLVGDQSAGKSSLMSALAGLNLPQSQGTCTRCPIHIRLSRAAEWCCRVSLQLDYAYKPETRSITARDVTRNRPFPPWEKQGREIKDFKTIRNPDESIESILKWAQLAILNPASSYQHFVPHDYEDGQGVSPPNDDEPTQAKFSPNTIALEITGPNLPDLSFYDLPGVFTNPGKSEDEYLVRVVQNLTREYVARENAIVLWAVPMNADPETSSSFSIIRGIKGADKRVLGVMTKADLLPKGNDHRWLAVLKGQAHATGLGYFITSRPDKHDLQEQEAWEEGFFNGQIDTDSPWPASFQEFEDRCGVTKLKDFLSRKLAAEFSKR
jgi:GTP-binding protein EngB required for normal cell division